MSGSPDVDAVVIPAAAEEGAPTWPLDLALAEWGDRFAAASGVGPLRRPPTAWCSWYHYFEHVTQDDIEENLAAIGDLDLRHRGRADRRRLPGRDRRLARCSRSGSPRCATSSTASATPGAGPASGSRRSWWGNGRPPPASTPTGWSRAPRRTTAGAAAAPGPRHDPPGGRGVPARGVRHLPRARHRLLQDRLHLRGGDGGPRADDGMSGTEAYRHGLRTDPRGHRPRLVPAGLRRADPAQRRPGRRHARGPGHRTSLRARSTRTSPSPRSAPPRRTAGGGRGSRAGSGPTTPTAWWPAATSSAGRTGPRSSSATAGCGPAATGSADSTSGGWRPPAGCSRAGLTAPFVP